MCVSLFVVSHLALLLLYDVTNKVSFDNIRAWLVEIREYAQEDVVIMLLGKLNYGYLTDVALTQANYSQTELERKY